MLRTLKTIGFLLVATNSLAQFTLQDTLRGSITPERAWWDLTYYHLDIKVDLAERTIAGSTTVQYRVLESNQRMQIDLQPPMIIEAVEQNGRALEFERLGNVYYITLQDEQEPGAINDVRIEYSGEPREALNAPWDGGFSWDYDDNLKPFVATSVQGDGASLWWPNKDHMYDEPDSMLISVQIPDSLMNVSNGRLRGIEKHDDGTHTSHWFVTNPINNYGVNINIGDYVHWSETYEGERGTLDLDFYVLRDNLRKARWHFKQTHQMLRAFEHWFGPYPFYEDGFKLVEVPYLGMEHQSSVTYGNGYQNGYRGTDLSGSGWGLLWDYIIIHEAGHEWFANGITYKDIADMWVHEGFTSYSENLYIDYHFGKKAGDEYVIGSRRRIQNSAPIIGQYGVNKEGSGDMYPKGMNLLHMIRTLLNDDEQWRAVLRGLNAEFHNQTVTTTQVEDYLIEHTGLDLAPVFDQYLRDFRIPTLEYAWDGSSLRFRWIDAIDSFNMPVEVTVGDQTVMLQPTTSWQSRKMGVQGVLDLNPNYYIQIAPS